MHLLIDDVRDVGADVIARTAAAGRRMLALGGWDVLYLDHDLGDPQDNGYRIATWAIEEGFMPPSVYVVTANPVGRQNIELALLRGGWEKVGPIHYTKGTNDAGTSEEC